MNLPTWEHCSKANEAGKKLNPLEQFIYDTEPAIVEVAWRAQVQAAIEFAIAEWVQEQVNNVRVKLYHWDPGDGLNPATRVRREVLGTVDAKDGRRLHALKTTTPGECIGCDLRHTVGPHAGLCSNPDFPCSPCEREDKEDVIYKLIESGTQLQRGGVAL